MIHSYHALLISCSYRRHILRLFQIAKSNGKEFQLKTKIKEYNLNSTQVILLKVLSYKVIWRISLIHS